LLNRPDLIGRLAGLWPGLANFLLETPVLRFFGEKLFDLHRQAPLPKIKGRQFRKWLDARTQPDGPPITYFTGCAIEYYDPGVGRAVVQVLNHLGYRVDAPSDACCGLPMMSNGELSAARGRAERLISAFAPGANAEQPIISTSTSCSLTIKAKYAAYLDLRGSDARDVAAWTFDIFEFLREHHMEDLAQDLRPLKRRLLYHAPCQLRSHAMGTPAVEVLRLIPGLQVITSNADCCGIGGTYGYQRSRSDISRAIARGLVDQTVEEQPSAILCDSETCRWHIAEMTRRQTFHPIEIIAESLFA
jgi:glycerol-3-phosphate dehydrogenase subunit C